MRVLNPPIQKPHSTRPQRRGFTLLEISLVIGLMIGLALFTGMNISAIQDWQKGKDAALALEAVFAAQRAYMADHPTADIADVTAAELESYLPTGWTTLPVVHDLDSSVLTMDHSVMPPQLLSGTSVYDPSGSGTDGLWDTGK